MKTKICKKCNQPFLLTDKVNGKRVRLYNRLFCLKCSPFGKHNTNDLCGFTAVKQIIDGMPHKICRVCETLKPLTDFYSRSEWGKRRAVCKTCNTEQDQKRRDAFKLWAVTYKGGQCQICGYNRCLKSLDFHHLEQSKKSFEISANWKKPKEIMIKELDKCLLICKNCHGEIHDGLFNPMSRLTMLGNRS